MDHISLPSAFQSTNFSQEILQSCCQMIFKFQKVVKVVERKDSGLPRALVKFCPKFTAENNLRNYSSGCKFLKRRTGNCRRSGEGVAVRTWRRVHMPAKPPEPVAVGLPPNGPDLALQRTRLPHFPEQKRLQPVRTVVTRTHLWTSRTTIAKSSLALEKYSHSLR